MSKIQASEVNIENGTLLNHQSAGCNAYSWYISRSSDVACEVDIQCCYTIMP